MVVFGNHQDQPVGTLTYCREALVFDLFTRVICRQLELADIDQLSLDAFAFFHLLKNKLRNVLTRTAFSHRAENNWNEEWSIVHRKLRIANHDDVAHDAAARDHETLARSETIVMVDAVFSELRDLFGRCAVKRLFPNVRHAVLLD